ncbi:MAG: phasin, PhaP, partial [Silicimonas sp.]|nr:phasin, PhaP [Silicimonas sp.]
MAKTQDPQAMMKEFLALFQVDTKSFEEAFKNTAAFNEKLAAVTLDAASRSSELSAKWTADTIAKLSDVSKAQSDPAAYAEVLKDFASAQSEIAASNMNAFAELAKKVQNETVELMVAAGKEISEEASASV